MKVKVKATEEYAKRGLQDQELGRIPSAGEIWEVSEERFKFLTKTNQLKVAFVERVEVEENKKEEIKEKVVPETTENVEELKAEEITNTEETAEELTAERNEALIEEAKVEENESNEKEDEKNKKAEQIKDVEVAIKENKTEKAVNKTTQKSK